MIFPTLLMTTEEFLRRNLGEIPPEAPWSMRRNQKRHCSPRHTRHGDTGAQGTVLLPQAARNPPLPSPLCGAGADQGPGGFLCISVPFAHTWLPTLVGSEVQFVGENLSCGGDAHLWDSHPLLSRARSIFPHPFLVLLFFQILKLGQLFCIRQSVFRQVKDQGREIQVQQSTGQQFSVLYLQQLLKDEAGA